RNPVRLDEYDGQPGGLRLTVPGWNHSSTFEPLELPGVRIARAAGGRSEVPAPDQRLESVSLHLRHLLHSGGDLLAAARFAAHAGSGRLKRVAESERVTIEQMPRWLDRVLGRPGRPALRGTPKVRRMKNYAALSGYAYEYFYEGYRDAGGRREY